MHTIFITHIMTIFDEQFHEVGNIEVTEILLREGDFDPSTMPSPDADPRVDPVVKERAQENMRSMFTQNETERNQFHFGF